MLPPTKCDFCSDARPRWIYPCASFNLDDLEGFPEGWGSAGDWAACLPCADLIEAEDWAGLERRATAQLRVPSRPLPRTPEAADDNMRAVHAAFRRYRSGRRRPAPPPETPTTLAGVYSRALDEQAKLKAILERPEVFRSMLASVTEAHGEEKGRGLIDLTYASVAQSEAGYVNRIVCEVLAQTAESIPDVTLEPEQLLTPNGFLWLQEPFSLGDVRLEWTEKLGPVRCLSWFGYAGSETDARCPRGGIFVVAWTMQDGHLAPLQATWVYGETWSEAASDRRTEAEGEVGRRMLRWLAALHAFVEQKLIVGRRGTPERAVRRRLERAGRPPSDILVVELRRAEQRRAAPDGERRRIAADFSFAVTGHWRRVWYESRQARQARWIFPYVKGNLSQPLRPRRRVFAIVH